MSAPSEAKTFDALEDRMLRGGIAPRHVRRYLRELAEHLADLTLDRRKAGYDEAEAAVRARAALGPDEELADAMLKQRDFRSISARFPWLVFGLLPPPVLFLGFMLYGLLVAGIALAAGVIVPHHIGLIMVPAWFDWTATTLMFLSNFMVGPLVTCGLALVAQRQRLPNTWPLLTIAIILVFGMHANFSTNGKSISIGLASILPILPRAMGRGVSVQWPIFSAQAVSILIPFAWLQFARRVRVS